MTDSSTISTYTNNSFDNIEYNYSNLLYKYNKDMSVINDYKRKFFEATAEQMAVPKSMLHGENGSSSDMAHMNQLENQIQSHYLNVMKYDTTPNVRIEFSDNIWNSIDKPPIVNCVDKGIKIEVELKPKKKTFWENLDLG